MLVYHNELKESLALAREHSMLLVSNGLDEYQSIESRLEYLKTYANQEDQDNTRCLLYSDFALYSFGFSMYHIVEDNQYIENKELAYRFNELIGYKYWFNGGLIFHGKHDNGGDGGAPTFSVNLTPVNGWSIHT